jgi:ribosome modulation factor
MTARNGKALTSIQQAWYSGFRAKLAGKSRSMCSLKSPILELAWMRGWDKCAEKEKK